jgi:hypothetical protein
MIIPIDDVKTYSDIYHYYEMIHRRFPFKYAFKWTDHDTGKHTFWYQIIGEKIRVELKHTWFGDKRISNKIIAMVLQSYYDRCAGY